MNRYGFKFTNQNIINQVETNSKYSQFPTHTSSGIEFIVHFTKTNNHEKILQVELGISHKVRYQIYCTFYK